jgi:hypothetical protein
MWYPDNCINRIHTLFRQLWTQWYYTTILLALLQGCSLSDLVRVDTSSNTDKQVDNEIVNSYSGAMGLYYEAVGQIARATSTYTRFTGFWTDELAVIGDEIGADIDARIAGDSSAGGDPVFYALSRARILAQHARGALQRYPGQASSHNIGELFAIEGMAEVMLAEGYCSGIPLTKAPYGENFQYTRGFSTVEVLRHAITLFDSALVYGADSVPVATLARVGKARALLNLGEYTEAEQVVAEVALNGAYILSYIGTGSNGYWTGFERQNGTIANIEGNNGMVWIAPTVELQDPRVPVKLDTISGIVQFSVPATQAKYVGGTTTQILADGIEAKLIQAETQLQPAENPGGSWLTTLNTLRATIGLPDTSDPGVGLSPDAAARARVDLLFRERAFWLYLTGHRQGDLRRLIRQYGRSFQDVYPVGLYPWPSVAIAYGNHATIGVHIREQSGNYLYHGCIDRNP